MGASTLSIGAFGANVAAIQNALQKLGYKISPSEIQRAFFGPLTQQAARQFQQQNALPVTADIDEETARAINAAAAALAPASPLSPRTVELAAPVSQSGPAPQASTPAPQASTYVISGQVTSAGRAAVGRLAVQIVDKNVGGDQPVVSGETTDAGAYRLSTVITPAVLSSRYKTSPDLQARVSSRAADGMETFLAASEIAYDAANVVTLDVALPSTATGLPSEYETLTAAIGQLYKGPLAALKETDDQQQDVSFLAQKTGWDPAAVAMAALAEQFARTVTAPAVASSSPTAAPSTRSAAAAGVPVAAAAAPPVSLQPAFYYALFRSGAPASADQLFRIPASRAAAIWTQAISQGVIPADLQNAIRAATQAFQTLAANQMLTASNLPVLVGSILTAVQQREFADLLSQYGGDWNALWTAAQAKFGPDLTNSLMKYGQLYNLTINNNPVVTALVQAVPDVMTSLQSLVTAGLYDPAKWSPLIGSSAIPAGFSGATPAEQAANYAAFLAAQVNLAFRTAVLAHKISQRVIQLAAPRSVAAEVSSFLSANQEAFAIGAEPVDAFIARTQVAAPSAAALGQIKALQRVYALTVEDEHMAVLLNHNLNSAYAITRYDEAGFIRAFGPQLGGAAAAGQIHRRARVLSNTTLNLALRYGLAQRGPAAGARLNIIDHGSSAQPLDASNPSPPSATLEGLFGSLDYCNCSDCSSILSPAAYFVDLLHYLDQPAPTAGLNPQTVLFTRRPDLEYLALSCENTNTTLPYIDIVNETLEAFVAGNLDLEDFEGFNAAADVTSAELIAAPQNVNDNAYAALQASFYPAPLPFNRPLELLRQHMKALGLALPDAMIALRASDAITDSGTPTSYGWSDVLIEQLGLSRDEYRLFTDATLQLGDLYGLPRASGQTDQQWNAATLANLQTLSLKHFSSRTSVDYDDLASILKTEFINPGVALIERVEALGLSFGAIQALQSDPVGNAAAFIAGLPAGLDYSQYGGTDGNAVVNWLTGPNYEVIMGLITVTNPTGIADDCTGTCLQFRYANPDTTVNLLTATDFLKLIRFIRLWRKLQPLLQISDDTAAIQLTDALISALYPATDLPVGSDSVVNDPTNRPLLDAGFKVALLRAGFLFQVLNRLSLASGSLTHLLACWANIGTTGSESLYANLFLTPTLLQQDPGSQATTVSPAVNAGDRLITSIDTVPIVYTVVTADTPQTVAGNIAAAINTTTTADPVSGLALNQRFHAQATGAQVVITAGFGIQWNVSGLGAGSLSAAPVADPTAQSATVGGAPAESEIFTITIDTIPVSYVAGAGDTVTTAAAGLAAAINATTAPHPYSGLPLNTLLAASAVGAVVTVRTADAGPPFDLGCSIQLANTGAYTGGASVPAKVVVTLSGAVTAADVVTVLLNNVALTYTVATTDSSVATLAASLANTINGAVQLDPTTSVPIGQLLHATASGATLTITPIDPSTPFTATISSSGTEQFGVAGPSPASQTAVVTGTFPTGAVLTTTINGVDLFQTVVAGDTADALATKIASGINASTLSDPTTGSPLNTLVSASASGGTVTVTAMSLTTAFTLAAVTPEGAYTAGRLNPPFADNGYGVYLDNPAQTLFGHQPLLCAACNLTGAEFALITAALNFDATTLLTLANVSAVFRYGWLAHALSISVLEFLALRRFSGLDPFAPLDPSPTPPATPPVVRFIQLVQHMQKAGLAPVQALYLIWNQDLSGTLAPQSDAVAALALALRADFATVESQFTLPNDDPDGSVAQQLMTKVYGATDTDFFFGLLNQTFTVSVSFSYVSPILPQPVLAAAGGLLAYDDAAKKFNVSGLLTAADETAIAAAALISTTATDNLAAGQVTLTPLSMTNIAPGAVLVFDSGAARETIVVTSATAASFTTTTTKAHDGSATPFPIVNDPGLPTALAALAAASQQAVAPFFAKYPELQALYMAYAASTAPLQTRRKTLLASFLPTLIDLRKVEQALAAITAQIGCDPSFAPAVLQDATILHADADAALPAVIDLIGVEDGGLTVELFLGNDPSQPPDQTVPAVGLVSYSQTATLGGAITAGAVITTTINGQAIAYTSTATDTSLDDLALQIAAAINAFTTVDPTSQLSINKLVTASASGAVVVIQPSTSLSLTAASVFSLACASSIAGLTYTAGSQLPAGSGAGAIAGRWSGFITPPQTGNYDICVVADPGAAVSLEINGQNVPMVIASGVWSNQAQIALTVGGLIPITLEVASLKTTLALGWRNPLAPGWTLIPATALFPGGPMAELRATYVRFLKTVSVASALSLTANEIAWLGTDITRAVGTRSASVIAPGNAVINPASLANITVGAQLIVDTGPAQETVTVTATTAASFTAVASKPHDGSSTAFPIVSSPQPVLNKGWLNSLSGTANADPVNAPTPDLATAAQLTLVLAAVLDFARLKQALSSSDERLLTALQNPVASLPNGQSALVGLAGWATVSAQALCARFFGDTSLAPLSDVENFARVYDAMTLVQACRVTAPALLAAVTNAPTPTTISGLQSALRALYAASDWLKVVQPINDSLRRLQRDALVKWILQGLSAQPGNTATTADDLYALFLIDPSTEPAVLTSRLSLALSAVQLFVERIRQSLESSVSPGDIDQQQWDWMGRYSLWEVVRKLFLWPENWLDPPLRDDQSAIFQQMMSSLLQSDITDDAATEAYLDYLSGLHDVAKLEPCGMYYVPATADTNEISYVVARGFGTTRYYFRELRDTAWSPWTEVPVDCEDMPLTPIVWNGRLFLFWLKVLKASPISPADAVPPSSSDDQTQLAALPLGTLKNLAASGIVTQVTVRATLYWTEYYNGKWQPTKSSDPRRPTTIGSYDPSGPGAFEAFRSRTRLVPATCTGAFAPRLGQGGGHGPVILLPSIPPNALILAVDTPQNPFPRQPQNSAGFSGGAGFLLHNTWSAPTPLEDVLGSLGDIGGFLDVPAPHRLIEAPNDPLATTLPPYSAGPEVGNLTISYFSTSTEVEQDTPELSRLVLQFNWQPRIVDAQPGLPGIWTAPLIYEDRRNLFYVTSTVDQTTFRGPSFGNDLAGAANGSDSASIPQLQSDISKTGRITVKLQGLNTVTYQGGGIQSDGSARAAAAKPSAKGA